MRLIAFKFDYIGVTSVNLTKRNSLRMILVHIISIKVKYVMQTYQYYAVRVYRVKQVLIFG